MHFSIRHLTSYRYEGPVTDNLNALRVRPATTSNQRCDEFHVRIDPETRVSRHVDYFGTEVLEFGVPTPHDHLTIDVRARVVTSEPPRAAGRPVERAHDARATSRPAASTCCRGGTSGLGRRARRPRRPAMRADDAARHAAPALRARSPTASSTAAARPTSARRSTTCSTPAPASARTSCTSRSCCCAARASRRATSRATCGPRPQDGGADSLEVDTHAWLEALLPGTDGRGEPVWVGADPTNRRLAGETHVKIGHGRFYADVPPVKGVFRGPPASGSGRRRDDVAARSPDRRAGLIRTPSRARRRTPGDRATLAASRLARGGSFFCPGRSRSEFPRPESPHGPRRRAHRYHPRVRGVQAAQLPDEQEQAELARSHHAAQVLQVVPLPHSHKETR